MDIDIVVRRMNTAINVQLEKLSAEESTRQIRFDTTIRAERTFNSVAVKVSTFALRIVYAQLQKVKLKIRSPVVNALPACTRKLISTMGLPCAHDLKRLMRRNQQLSVEDFDKQWRLRVTPTQNLIPDQFPLPEYICLESGYDENKISEVNAQLEAEFSNQVFAAEAREARRSIADMDLASVLFTPNIVDQLNERPTGRPTTAAAVANAARNVLTGSQERTNRSLRGQPGGVQRARGNSRRGARSQSSTQRDPSGFEYIASGTSSTTTPQRRTCTVCRASSYNRATCPTLQMGWKGCFTNMAHDALYKLVLPEPCISSQSSILNILGLKPTLKAQTKKIIFHVEISELIS
ncbi:hypothetical protein [Parasitella parasitica]|uniref:Uncharacterized protein n=1 Tax=Parasitella parasitica TaxID=35722 RepID=A0A0B7NWG7_9FUNG|nr:hypothetical protein [Parasitella parasitica]